MIVIIDNGHGAETAGKRSPDGRLLEWRWARDVAERISEELKAHGVEARLLVPEERDVPLRERVGRANAIAGSKILVSIHANAAGMGEWKSARGWSAFVAPNAGNASKRLAALLAASAEAQGFAVRRPAPGADFWTQSLAICRDTTCPAVLTENLFMDNREDLEMMLSEEGRYRLARAHVGGITEYLRIDK